MSSGIQNLSYLTVIDDQNRELDYSKFVEILLKKQSEDLMVLHCGLGICGEAGELADAIKREVIYEKDQDRENIVEEIGDCFWYLQATMNRYKITLEEVLQYNYRKLSKRYDKLTYTDEAAQNRADKNG